MQESFLSAPCLLHEVAAAFESSCLSQAASAASEEVLQSHFGRSWISSLSFLIGGVLGTLAWSAVMIGKCAAQVQVPDSVVPMGPRAGGFASAYQRSRPICRGFVMILFLALLPGLQAGGYFPLSELEETGFLPLSDETVFLPLSDEVRLADQQRLRRQSIRALEFHQGGTLLAPNADSVHELIIIAASEDLDTVIFTPQMLCDLWHTIPPSPSSHTIVDSDSDCVPDAQHDLSPDTLARHVITGPMSSATPVMGASSVCQHFGHTASVAASPVNVASATRQERVESGDASSSPQRPPLPSDSDITPYNRWNSISNTSTSAAPSRKGGLQPAELEHFLIRTGVKRKRGTAPRRCLVTSSTSGINSMSSCAPPCATTTRWAHSDDDDDDPIEPFDVMHDPAATHMDSMPGVHDWVHGLPFQEEDIIQVPVQSQTSSEAASAAEERVVDELGRVDVEAMNRMVHADTVRRAIRVVRYQQKHMPLRKPMPRPGPSIPAAAFTHEFQHDDNVVDFPSPDVDEVLAMGQEDIVGHAAGAAGSSACIQSASAEVLPTLPWNLAGAPPDEADDSISDSPASAQGLALLQSAICCANHDQRTRRTPWGKAGRSKPTGSS
eukprot:6492649-Amphidinium_carterae.3